MTVRVSALLLAAIALTLACGREQTPSERLAEAISVTESAKTFTFTLDGDGRYERGEQLEELFFGASGEVVFPDRVHMVVNIDQAGGGVRSELRHIEGVLYIRPGTPDAKWQRSTEDVELAGFDPLASFDFKTLSETRRPTDAGRDVVDGVAVRKLRLVPTEETRSEMERNLPAGFEGTRLGVRSDLFVAIETGRIVRVIQRFDYLGASRGYFETDLRLQKFGTRVRIEEPTRDELSGDPLVLNPTPAP